MEFFRLVSFSWTICSFIPPKNFTKIIQIKVIINLNGILKCDQNYTSKYSKIQLVWSFKACHFLFALNYVNIFSEIYPSRIHLSHAVGHGMIVATAVSSLAFQYTSPLHHLFIIECWTNQRKKITSNWHRKNYRTLKHNFKWYKNNHLNWIEWTQLLEDI